MTTSIPRRDFLTAASLGLSALAVASDVKAAQTPAAPAGNRPAAKYESRPLPFDPKKIKGLSEKILVSHHDNNYVGAVNRLTAISAQMAALDFEKTPGYMLNGLKREELMATNSMILHEVYFASIGEPNAPDKALADAIARDFGGMAQWQAEFVAMGKAEGGGSGWVLLTYSPRDRRLMNTWAADHTMTLAGGEPLLALDMYEHAYHMDYGAKAGDYVTAFMGTINWSNANKAFARHA